ncbi:MAG TPA: hypothetical protein VFU47_11170, partial [Armatimonadota bacterium]|nr:hypothetical protein [Armatimonadota bacterium]
MTRHARTLRLIPLLLAAIALIATQRGGATAPRVTITGEPTSVHLERVAPITIISAETVELTARNSVGDLLAQVPLKLSISGETGDTRTVEVTTDSNGQAQYPFRPTFPGLLRLRGFYDGNRNGSFDLGEPTIEDVSLAIAPLNNLGSRLYGSGGLDLTGLFPGSPGSVTGSFKLNVRSSSAGRLSGNVTLDAPSMGLRARSTRLDGFAGYEYSPMVSGGVIYGEMNTNLWGKRSFRVDGVDEGSAGAGQVHFSFLNDDGTSRFAGGDVLPMPRLRNRITYLMGTRRDPDPLQIWPRSLDYGTVTPQVFHPKPLYFFNIGGTSATGTLDASHVSSTYFTFFPQPGAFSVPAGELFSYNAVFGSQGQCTHRGYL